MHAFLPSSVTRPDAQALMGKYSVLLRLRRERDALELRGVFVLRGAAGEERRRAARALAQDFPGALHELEYRSAEEMEERIEHLQAGLDHLVRDNAYAWAPWVGPVRDFHVLAREALAIKRWLRDHAPAGTPPLREFRRWYTSAGVGPRIGEQLDGAFVERYIRPPSGRWTELVWRDLSAAYGRPTVELKQMVLGAAGVP